MLDQKPDHKLSELYYAFKQEKNIFEINVWIRQPLKWNEMSFEFRSVFSGSNDRGTVEKYENICAHLNDVSKYQPLVLFSVIGGCFFFDLLRDINFNQSCAI